MILHEYILLIYTPTYLLSLQKLYKGGVVHFHTKEQSTFTPKYDIQINYKNFLTSLKALELYNQATQTIYSYTPIAPTANLQQ